MKFSFIGTNRRAAPLLQELSRSTEHSLMLGAVAGSLEEAVTLAQIPFRRVPEFEEAVVDPDSEAVIVALENSEETLRISRAASQSGKHIVVIPPPDCSPAFSFELHLILDESSHSIISLTDRWLLPDLAPEEHQLALDRTNVLQIALELPVSDCSAESLTSQILGGLDVIGACGFHYTQITAMESWARDGKLLSLFITLNSQPGSEQVEPPATLILKPSETVQSAEVGLRINRSDGTQTQMAIVRTANLLPRINSLCRHREMCSRWMESFSETLELSEAVKKSLKRRRTVDVHFDSGSERGVFKSQMTAIGCGVLTFMMFGMVAFLVVAQVVDLPRWVLYTARILWITPLVIFLLAQALLPIARDRASNR